MHSDRKYRASLFDDSEPEYAPGLSWSGIYPRWKAPKKYIDAGWSIKSCQLPGKSGDGQDLERASRCRQFTREMLKFYEGEIEGKLPGTWGWLIGRYRSDEFSFLHRVKYNTKELYIHHTNLWEGAVGKVEIEATDHESIMRWYTALAEKRTSDTAKRMVAQLGRLAKYGIAINAPGANEVVQILGVMRLPSNKTRSVAPSRAQVYSIIDAAIDANLDRFALGLMIQYELALRPSDVIGQWSPDQGQGGITNNSGKRWSGGLMWSMFDTDITTLTKMAEKTKNSEGAQAVDYDLTIIPHLREMLLSVPVSERVGPVIINRAGKPYERNSWRQQWGRLRDKIGLPKEVKNMDLRAGALTEGKNAGARAESLRDLAQHSNVVMTSRYMRDPSKGANEVIQMRQKERKPNS